MSLVKHNPAYDGKQGLLKHTTPLYDNKLFAQHARILKIFEEKPSQSTFDFRARGILHPAGRIKELRENGHIIKTHFIKQNDVNDVPHRVALYFYCGKQQEAQR